MLVINNCEYCISIIIQASRSLLEFKRISHFSLTVLNKPLNKRRNIMVIPFNGVESRNNSSGGGDVDWLLKVELTINNFLNDSN